jgi:hypothetical protein
MQLAERSFTLEDQRLFASFSGDYNPVHLDEVQARRTQAGAPIVHGMNLLLNALEAFATTASRPLRQIRVQFTRFVYVGQPAEFVLSASDPSRAIIVVKSQGVLCATVKLEFGTAEDPPCDFPRPTAELVVDSMAPTDLSPDQMSGMAGTLGFADASAAAPALFPSATAWLDADRIGAFASLTRLVGMVCPGLHSLFAGLSLTTCSNAALAGAMAFSVTDVDLRFRRVELAVCGGGWSGLVSSFARMAPVRQASMTELRRQLQPNEFRDAVALVVGGSRGLGELVAKAVTAGGGKVIVSWARGREDAERVAAEIRTEGGHCETLAFDARKPADGQLANLPLTPTHLYYFATPTIGRPKPDLFDPALFAEFIQYYVHGFWQVAQTCLTARPGLAMFYPSTVYVADAPRGMTEYAMSKAAGERLCEDINRFLAPAHVTVARLPRLLTDQTATIGAADLQNPLQIMLPIVRQVQSLV